MSVAIVRKPEVNPLTIAALTASLYCGCCVVFCPVIKTFAIEPNALPTVSFWKIQCKLPPKTKRFCPLVLK